MKNKILLALATIIVNIIVWLVPVPDWFKALFTICTVFYTMNAVLPKEHDLFKKIFIAIFIFVILSWIIAPGSLSSNTISIADETTRLGIWNVFNIFASSLSSFAIYGLFLVAVGAFYVVLNKTQVYQRIVEKIAKKTKKKPVLFVAIIAFIFAALSSVTNLGLILFLFVPFVASIIFKMGYDKFTAATTTIGALFVGIIGSTLGYYVSYVINATLGLDFTTNIIAKLVLFVLSLGLLIFYIKGHMSKIKAKKSIELKTEADDMLYEEVETKSKRKALPMVIILCLILVLTLISTFSWSTAFGIDLFTNFHNKVSELPVLMDVLGKPMVIGYYTQYGINALGSWDYIDISIILVIASFVIGLIYKVKFKDIAKSFVEGFKKFVKPAFLIILAYTLFILNYYVPVFTTIIDYFGNSFNIVTSSVVAALSSVINIDMMYVAQNSMAISNALINDSSVASTLALLYQAIYGLVQFIVPTSSLLIVLLCYFKISYKEWFKYIWKLVLQLLVIILITLIVLMLI